MASWRAPQSAQASILGRHHNAPAQISNAKTSSCGYSVCPRPVRSWVSALVYPGIRHVTTVPRGASGVCLKIGTSKKGFHLLSLQANPKTDSRTRENPHLFLQNCNRRQALRAYLEVRLLKFKIFVELKLMRPGGTAGIRSSGCFPRASGLV